MPNHIKPASDNALSDFVTPTQAEMDAHLRRAHVMRAEAVQAMGRAFRAWVRSFFQAKQKPATDLEAISALTALRSSAEALRDNPDTHRDTRLRLVDIVLKEEARLERIFTRLGRDKGGPVAP